ncbi:hypothetical protein FE783_15235 [Paenibacillus mesophilus]|uniref:hypothetical protein n=1 Tax=Paenibacillus mesophilus TaxID=2582849 RepID=UPI00110E09C1|nr:hypothetical protein [Paenibacillus mesophilus]TMV49022.1 hypothetical protein FE783_15235 [Paenibacillus mesophilus]
MRIWVVSLLVISMLGLVGCSKPTQFKGESTNWSVTCSVRQSAKVKSYQIRYIGPDKDRDSQVSYSFADSQNFKASKESSTTSLNGLKISGESSNDAPYVDEDQFKLHIKWNGKEETIQIEKVK